MKFHIFTFRDLNKLLTAPQDWQTFANLPNRRFGPFDHRAQLASIVTRETRRRRGRVMLLRRNWEQESG